MISVNRTKKKDTKEEILCPKAAAVYNDVMLGVDCFDQRKEIYQIRSSVKWGYRIFYLLIDLAIINSFILWQVNKRNRSLDQLTFLTALVRELIDGYSSIKRKRHPASFQPKKCIVLYDVRLTSVRNHLPKRWFPTIDDVGNVTERDKKRGPANTCAECDVLLGI
ncbi:piggyBac transposable element-derived protein 4 [Trichonephila clavipes]|nr:piggyBac transposable element-derived protein 4 [Trichonephila clavipes]